MNEEERMKTKGTILFTIVLFFFIGCTHSSWSQLISEWRGTGRTGVYPDKGLMKAWPTSGPRLLWAAKDLPKGNSSVSIGHQTIYLTGLKDSMDVLIALDMAGNLKWQTPYGRAWNGSFPESRSTPTIDGNFVYVTSGLGDIACLDALTGKLSWSVQSIEEFGGKTGMWGIAESPLVVNDIVIYTCGGDQTTILGLDKQTGKPLWKTISLHEKPSYCSPLLIQYNGITQVVALTEHYILGIQPDNGQIIWRFDYGKYASPENRNNNTNTPLFDNGKLFVSSGYDHKSVMLRLSQDASNVDLLWVDSTMDVHLGGMVRQDSLIFGSTWSNNSNGNWACISWNTGHLKYENKWHNKGAIIAADGLLYCLEEKNGNMALVRPNPEKFEVISSFRIPFGTGPYWAHPVIHDKILYVRHGEALMAFILVG